MGEALLLALWLGTTIFLGCKIERGRKERESREWWLSDVKGCISGIKGDFRRDCEKIAENEFSRQIFDECRYSNKIRELEEKYKGELTEKVIARMGKYRVKSVPEHLIREYECNISEIADLFRYFGKLH